MISSLFIKKLSYDIDEKICYDEVLSKPEKVWLSVDYTSKNNDIKFIRKKVNYAHIAKLIRFPITITEILKYVPDAIIENSYILKISPNECLDPHFDIGRKSTINIPLGENKGSISYFIFNKKIFTYDYEGPTLTRVNFKHSGINNSPTEFRYLISVDIPGGYFKNFFFR